MPSSTLLLLCCLGYYAPSNMVLQEMALRLELETLRGSVGGFATCFPLGDESTLVNVSGQQCSCVHHDWFLRFILQQRNHRCRIEGHSKMAFYLSKEQHFRQKITITKSLKEELLWCIFRQRSCRCLGPLQLLLVLGLFTCFYIGDAEFRTVVNQSIVSILCDMVLIMLLYVHGFFSWCNPLLLCTAAVLCDAHASTSQIFLANLTTVFAVVDFHLSIPFWCTMASYILADGMRPGTLFPWLCLIWPMLGRKQNAVENVPDLPAALRNGGNSCYMNAVLQSLWSCVSAKRLLHNRYVAMPGELQGLMVRASKDPTFTSSARISYLDLLSEATYLAYEKPAHERDPVLLKLFLQMYHRVSPRHGLQQDAHEFLQKDLLDDSNRFDLTQGTNNELAKLFEGSKSSVMICSKGHEIENPDIFYQTWIVPLRDESGHPIRTLAAAWSQSIQPEQPDEDFRFRCSECGCRQRPQMRTELHKARTEHHKAGMPEILCLVLKRWVFNSNNAANPILLHHAVAINETDQFNGIWYRLRAVVFHSGATVGSGHYWAVVQHVESNGGLNWFTYNDATMTKAKPGEYMHSRGGHAYLVFYEKMSAAEQQSLEAEAFFLPMQQDRATKLRMLLVPARPRVLPNHRHQCCQSPKVNHKYLVRAIIQAQGRLQCLLPRRVMVFHLAMSRALPRVCRALPRHLWQKVRALPRVCRALPQHLWQKVQVQLRRRPQLQVQLSTPRRQPSLLLALPRQLLIRPFTGQRSMP